MFNSRKQVYWVRLVFVLFNLSSYVEAQVSPLILAKFVTLGLLYEEFLMHSLRVSPVCHHIQLRTKLPIACFQLIYKYLYGEKYIASPSICLLQWKYFGMLLEEHWLWMWLCGINLVIDMECNCRNEYLCDCFVTVFSHMYLCSCWYRLWHQSSFQSSYRSFSILLLLVEGDCLVEHLFWQIWISSFFNCI